MSKNTLVSIIIPVYNRETIVKKALDAAISQTYSNIEIIVCDNASTDNTWQVLFEYSLVDSRIKIFKNEENLGPVRNWNKCLNLASGKYVKILWSDDSISSDYLEKTVPVLEQYAEVGFVYTKTNINILGSNTLHYRWSDTGLYKTQDFIQACLFEKVEIPVSPGCALFRRTDLIDSLRCDIPNEFGLDFARYGAGNDLLLFLYNCKRYEYFYFIDETLSFFYGGKDSISITTDLFKYYTYSKYYFVEECADKKIKNAFYTKLLFGFMSTIVQEKDFNANWKIAWNIFFPRLKEFIRYYGSVFLKLVRHSIGSNNSHE